jgi:AcrR family transcriptional regulator
MVADMTARGTDNVAGKAAGRAGGEAPGMHSYQLGKSLTVTVPEVVAEQVSAAFAEAFGKSRKSKRAARSGADRLSADRIVDVAIDQMRERGYDAVTMRSIAKELGTGPASLYAHVASREELDQLVIGRVSSQWRVPDPDPEHWAEQVRASLHDLASLMRAHPGVARCAMGMIPTTAGTLLPTERMLALLRAGGVSEQDAAWFIDISTLYVGGTVMEEDIWRARGSESHLDPEEVTEEQVVGRVRELFASLPEDHFPTIRSMAVALTTGSGEERFDFGLDLLIAGLQSRT